MKNYKLPKKFAEKWVDSLRSGKYKQTQGTLIEINKITNEKSFCCLGVAATICGVKTKILLKYPLDSLSVQGSLNIKKDIGDLKTKEGFNQIFIDMNDNGKTFNEIADWIETNVDIV